MIVIWREVYRWKYTVKKYRAVLIGVLKCEHRVPAVGVPPGVFSILFITSWFSFSTVSKELIRLLKFGANLRRRMVLSDWKRRVKFVRKRLPMNEYKNAFNTGLNQGRIEAKMYNSEHISEDI